MTYLHPEDDLLAQQIGQTVKCSWCGEIIRLDVNELALAMCQACYEQMLGEFLRTQQTKEPSTHASDS